MENFFLIEFTQEVDSRMMSIDRGHIPTGSSNSFQSQDRYRTLPSRHQDKSRLILTASPSGHGISGPSDTDYENCLFLRTPSVRTLELLKEKRESIV